MRNQSLSVFSNPFVNPFKSKQATHSVSPQASTQKHIEEHCLSRSLTNIFLINEAKNLPINFVAENQSLSSLPSYDEACSSPLPGLPTYNDSTYLPTYLELESNPIGSAYDKTNNLLPSYDETLNQFSSLKKESPAFLQTITKIKDHYLSIKHNQYFFKISKPVKAYGKEDAIKLINKHRLSEEKNKHIPNDQNVPFKKYNKQVHDLAIKYFKYLSDINYKQTFKDQEINQYPALQNLSAEFAGKLQATHKISQKTTNHLLQAAHETIINQGYKDLAQQMKRHGLVTETQQKEIYLPQIETLNNLKSTLQQRIANDNSAIFMQFILGQESRAASIQSAAGMDQKIYRLVNGDHSISQFNTFEQFFSALENIIYTNNINNGLSPDRVVFQQYHQQGGAVNILDS
ncbi:TPA: hypothetical protein ACS727_002316 [Providencia alcalifaciens]|uniref:hypothetical protein n=1 Tax=Providencia alcalifaciens TaxID=126385 RepID=UPI001CC5B0CC|nr:hypothetical protein NVI2019_NGLDDFDA_00214 [Providencia alcalifaciens]